MKTPEVWTMQEDEVSAGVYRIVATTADGRRIEATGSDEERLHQEVMRLIATLDFQVKEKQLQ
jgi:hypothetical protein